MVNDDDPNALFSEFEDLEETNSNSVDMDDEDDAFLPPKKMASDMNSHELRTMLIERGITPKGFEDEDAETLQKILDEDYDRDLESKRQERKEARVLAAKQAGLAKRRQKMDQQLHEEQVELEKDGRMEFFLQLIKNNSAPSTARIQLNDITSRSMAKALWSTSCIVALDVSRMQLSDLAGAYLCRALKNNRSIVKLDLESNKFGPKTCSALADALLTNNVVTHVNLESNMLVKNEVGSHDVSGVAAIADMLCTNKALLYLNLWRCNVQSEGGHQLVNGIMENQTLIFFEVGNNGLVQSQHKRIAEKLDQNKGHYEAVKELHSENQRKAEASAAVLKAQEDEKNKKEQLHQWMEDQKVTRANQRREELEAAAAKARAEAAQRREEEAERLKKEAEEAAAKEAKKKKKKGKKK
ncbi:hypothetical protein TL16_g06649 [Triparma laevis f. inornata]|uniref:Uncharacterized protein n=2 Tax=Triparma laevis TaxID=1534972 RepID=A0A9W7FUC7_9STRA|nr:hypothetical protein TL16_g06649 [Triparma laevis f. inornata]GMI18404.1 hypothetical protein TrLO_g15674 [Triparma laevis f. longispina]